MLVLDSDDSYTQKLNVIEHLLRFLNDEISAEDYCSRYRSENQLGRQRTRNISIAYLFYCMQHGLDFYLTDSLRVLQTHIAVLEDKPVEKVRVILKEDAPAVRFNYFVQENRHDRIKYRNSIVISDWEHAETLVSQVVLADDTGKEKA
ncbi:hypothetical protein [Lactobacillus selangorensis]|uniref:hypothetical protein n=1 Tax=Lactobacillus selangorensis TaxID=81857 RepID=UPI00070FA86D|nr:hypothetical protein [Lactobacillus selangorensis]